MFDVSYGAGDWETQFATKADAIAWARNRKLESFAVVDSDDTVVYEEFPQPKWV
jgi:hypothetical protein